MWNQGIRYAIILLSVDDVESVADMTPRGDIRETNHRRGYPTSE